MINIPHPQPAHRVLGTVGALTLPPVSGDDDGWILGFGAWRDSGTWIDGDNWKDS